MLGTTRHRMRLPNCGGRVLLTKLKSHLRQWVMFLPIGDAGVLRDVLVTDD